MAQKKDTVYIFFHLVGPLGASSLAFPRVFPIASSGLQMGCRGESELFGSQTKRRQGNTTRLESG